MTYDRGMKMHSIWPDGTDGDKFTGACKDQKLGSLSQQSVSGMNNFCFESESYKNWFQEKKKKNSGLSKSQLYTLHLWYSKTHNQVKEGRVTISSVNKMCYKQ